MNSINQEILTDTNTIVNQLKLNFNDEYNNVIILFDYYTSLLTNTQNTMDLYKEYLDKNIELEKNIRNSHSDILTNDRKTYYETEAHDRLDKWYKILKWVYYIFVFMLIISLVFTIQPLSLWKKISTALFFILYPIIITYILDYIYDKFYQVKRTLPKNVYNTL
jgi:hypothetical protein